MANLGLGTSKLKPRIVTDAEVSTLDPSTRVRILSEYSFYTRPSFEFVTENLNSSGQSISIDLQGRDLTDFIQFKNNLVLPIDDISQQFNGISSTSSGDNISGISTFSLKYNLSSFLKKSFSPSSIESNSGEILNLKRINHDFSTGEKVTYEYYGSPIEIESASFVGIGVTSILPSEVYIIKNSQNFIKLASSEENAYAGIGLTFSSVSAGSTHYFTSTNVLPRSLITIDNLIQSPLYRKGLIVGLGTTSVGVTTTVIPLSGISTILTTDFLYVDDEIMKIESISVATTSINVERGAMGTVAAAHTDGSSVEIYSGNYNIVGENIYFSSPPSEESTFFGRIFYKSNYDRNLIFDDLSSQFVGTAKTFNLKYNYSDYGLTTSTVTGNQYGILSLNGIFQKPVLDYELQQSTGITTLTFNGESEFDLPNSGRILSFSYTNGLNYQPQVSAAATVTVSAAGTISDITLTSSGGGYLTAPTVSLASTVGTGASIVAFVGTGSSVGFITGFSITNPGTGYTDTSIPLVVVAPPYGYTDLSLTYVSGSSAGQGAKVSVVVGSGGSITSVILDEIGFGYVPGDVLTISGIGTLPGFVPFTLSVTDTYTDRFSFWTFGQLKRCTVLENSDGIRRIFTVTDTITGELINFETNRSDTRFKIENNLLVLVNGIIQKPIIDYTVSNSFIRFGDAVIEGQEIDIYVYTASNLDSVVKTVPQTIKTGDTLKIIGGRGRLDEIQDNRTAYRIDGKNRIRTSTYYSVGIDGSSEAFRKLDWTKQTRDVILANKQISKARDSYNSSIRPKSSLLVGIETSSTEIYVEDIQLFKQDNISESELQIDVVKDIPLFIATATATVSSAGTVSSITVTDGGSGYSQLSPPSVSISKLQILNSVKFEEFSFVSTGSSINYLDSKYGDGKIVSVGSSLRYRYTSNFNVFTNASIASSTTQLNAISYGSSIWVVAGSDGYISTSTNLSSWNRVGIATINQGTVPESISQLTFTNSINSLTYSPTDGRFVGVGSTGNIFTYEISDLTRANRYKNNFIRRTSNTTQNLNKVIVGQVYDVGEDQTKTQYVAVGNSCRVVLSATSIDSTLISNPPGLYWIEKNLSTLSGVNFNSVVHTGISTLPFIVVGDNGLILTFSDNRFLEESFYQISPSPTSENLKSVVYDSETETAVVVGTSGSIFTSTRLSRFRDWNFVSSGSTTNFNNIEYFEPLNQYLISGQTDSLINNTQKIGAAATAVVSVAGTVSSIVISDGGRFYDTDPNNPPNIFIGAPLLVRERFKSCKLAGDYGQIVGITTSSGISTDSPAISFSLLVNAGLPTSRSFISTGDYFATYNTNVGNGITSIESDGSVIGIGTTFIDCVFRADQVDNDGVSGIVTVISNVSSVDELTSIATTYYNYGNYSWGKIYDFDTRSNPIQFDAENLNGSSGLIESPKALRLTSIGTTIVPLEA